MADIEASLTTRVTQISLGAHVLAAAVLESACVYALADGAIVFVEGGREIRRAIAHPDATILVVCADSRRLVTGGDDGRIIATDAAGRCEEISHERGKWIDAVASRADGAVAWSFGKEVRARDAKGAIRTLAAPSSVRGLAFFAKGYRLALAHYNGVSLWFPNATAVPETLEWRGSHLGVTLSADGRFAVSSMQESALHGWRIADRKNMRMTGYPSKTRSFSWSHDGDWLATSGAEACIIWPFASKDGPMGTAPRELGARPARVSQVAFHPKSSHVAVGYDDGWILLCRLGDGAELVVRSPPPETKQGVSALSWSGSGDLLLFGTMDGTAGVLDMPS
ncbi:MAG TPA: WD40 repeat domain-containing protein [Beijerinckiaceae bacterium]|nr:WD40 repeat domain-containing protein [Beijerinckiaceae bacterium]